jgi:hypothetical protein
VSLGTTINDKERTIVVNGDREAVSFVCDKINTAVSGLTSSLKSVSLSVPRKQHRLITGDTASELFETYSVFVLADDVADSVTIWGEQEKLYPALGPVLEVIYLFFCLAP